MTIRAYITDKLKAYGLTESQIVDLSLFSGLDLETEVSDNDEAAVGSALIHALEECILAPRMSNVSESGFSVSWNYDSVGKYYLWLCRKWRVAPDDDVVALLGLSSIVDKTDCW